MIPEGVQHVFSGHYHPYMRVTDKATVVGTPLQLTWADTGDHRGFIVYDTDHDVQVFHPIDAPRFVTLNMKGMGVADYDYQEKVGNTASFRNNFVRVVDYHSGYTEEIREGIMGAGARSVEFVVKLEQVDRLQPVSSDGLHIPDLVEEYEKQKGVSDERREIRKELMK
jgi:metallophosphoesterase superfamily enzyme